MNNEFEDLLGDSSELFETQGDKNILDILDQKPEFNNDLMMSVAYATYKEETGSFSLQVYGEDEKKIIVQCFPDTRIGVSITEKEVKGFIGKVIYIKSVKYNSSYRDSNGKTVDESFSLKYLADSIAVIKTHDKSALEVGIFETIYKMDDFLTVNRIDRIKKFTKQDPKTKKWDKGEVTFTEVVMKEILEDGKPVIKKLLVSMPLAEANALVGKRVKFTGYPKKQIGKEMIPFSSKAPLIEGDTKSTPKPTVEVKSAPQPEQK
ncbi:MAG: hypothetical protein Q8J85_07215 [Sulfuricurvum sp.]|nr:hypothetical protein [Sulfuricurvum sp.]MDP3022984.1 hypothetical protein [Sulfuricurvum sp.]